MKRGNPREREQRRLRREARLAASVKASVVRVKPFEVAEIIGGRNDRVTGFAVSVRDQVKPDLGLEISAPVSEKRAESLADVLNKAYQMWLSAVRDGRLK